MAAEAPAQGNQGSQSADYPILLDPPIDPFRSQDQSDSNRSDPKEIWSTVVDSCRFLPISAFCGFEFRLGPLMHGAN